MNKNIYHKLGSEFRKYLWVFIIIGMTFYFWPQDHFKNCLNDFRNILKGKYNDKEDRQGAILLCEQIKKSNPDLFREYKGKIFTKTTLFIPR